MSQVVSPEGGRRIPVGELAYGESGKGWRIGRMIGEGGTAQVYIATAPDDSLGAAKILSDHRFPVGSAMRERFAREAAHLNALRSRHVVRVLDRARFDGELVLVMELAHATLHAVLADARPMPLSQALTWLQHALEGVATLHDANLTHRDLSPKNLLIRGDGDLIVGDFGTVRHLHDDTITAPETVLGSLLYISPDQFEDAHQARPTDDVYSLGQIAYELLAGIKPLGNVRSLERVKPGLPSWIAGFVDCLRAAEPAERPPDARCALHRLSTLIHAARERESAVYALGARVAAAQTAAAEALSSAKREGRDRTAQETRRAKAALSLSDRARREVGSFLGYLVRTLGPVRLVFDEPDPWADERLAVIEHRFRELGVTDQGLPLRALGLFEGSSLEIRVWSDRYDAEFLWWVIARNRLTGMRTRVTDVGAAGTSGPLMRLDATLTELPRFWGRALMSVVSNEFGVDAFTRGAPCSACGVPSVLQISERSSLSRVAICPECDLVRCGICGEVLERVRGADGFGVYDGVRCSCGDIPFDKPLDTEPWEPMSELRPTDVYTLMETDENMETLSAATMEDEDLHRSVIALPRPTEMVPSGKLRAVPQQSGAGI